MTLNFIDLSNPFPNNNNSKFGGNGTKFSERGENTVGKGEIARYEQFLFFKRPVMQTR